MGTSVEVFKDPSTGTRIVNATELDWGSIRGDVEPVVATLQRWVRDNHPQHRQQGLATRDRFLTPNLPFEQIRAGREAMSDDVVALAYETSETLAISGISVYCDDPREQELWNLIAADLDLDSRLREMWYTLFTDSQVVTSSWWQPSTYELEDGSTVDVVAPRHLSVLDTLKVVPVGMLMFGQEALAYRASPVEAARFDAILGLGSPSNRGMSRYGRSTDGDFLNVPDPIVQRLLVDRYEPDMFEMTELSKDGIGSDFLYLMDPRFTFRHTLTRPAFKRFADVRMKSVFRLLDMKAQLMQSDRAMLVGSANYIVLLTKGSDKEPASPGEVARLQANARLMTSAPVIVGDHRLKVEIITPSVDHTIDAPRYDTLDVRIFARLMQTFKHGSTGASASVDDMKMGAVIAKGLEGRRRMLRRAVEGGLFETIRKSNPGVLKSRATLQFKPSSISLSFDQGLASFMLDMRMANEISRNTLLSQFDLSEATEAKWREREAEEYDHIFQTQDPASPGPTPDPGDQGEPGDGEGMSTVEKKSAGRTKGGNRNGGGAAPGSGQGQDPRKPRHLSDMDMVELPRDQLIAMAGEHAIPGRYQMRKVDLVRLIIEAQKQEDADA